VYAAIRRSLRLWNAGLTGLFQSVKADSRRLTAASHAGFRSARVRSLDRKRSARARVAQGRQIFIEKSYAYARVTRTYISARVEQAVGLAIGFP
jgi:hypothetical protein